MKIQGNGRVQNKRVDKTKRKGASDGTAFASELSGASANTAATSVSSGGQVASLGGLLALQEVPDSTDGRSKGLARGAEMLDLLEEVRKGLLLGAIPVARLKMLAQMARGQRETGGDPRLMEILEEIELRAEVELAKLGA